MVAASGVNPNIFLGERSKRRRRRKGCGVGVGRECRKEFRIGTTTIFVVVVVLLYGLVSTRLQHSKNIHSCVASQ